MKRIASPRRRKAATKSEAGFTLIELIVGLLVGSLLIVGLVELTHRYGQTTSDVRETVADVRAGRSIESVLTLLERADPGSLVVTSDRIEAKIGSDQVSVGLQTSSSGLTLEWRSPGLNRSIDVPSASKFEQRPDGLILLLAPSSQTPIAMTMPRRELPFDCQFDTVTLECRQ